MMVVLADPYAGKTPAQLRADCRRLLRIAWDRERVIKEMIVALGDKVDELPPYSRDYAKRLIEAYKD